MTGFWIVLGTVSSFAGNGAEADIRDKAMFICQHGQIPAPTLEAFPEETKPADYLRREDVDVLVGNIRKEDEPTADETALSLVVFEAISAVTKCRVTDVSVKGSAATATLRQSAPDPPYKTLLNKIREWSKVDRRETRLAQATKWLKGLKLKTAEQTVDFVETPDGWRADFRLPEKKIKEQVGDLLVTAWDLSSALEFRAAQAKLEEALRLDPNNEEVKERLAENGKYVAMIVEGKWLKDDPTRDDETRAFSYSVRLPAEPGERALFGRFPPFLVATCFKGEFDLSLRSDAVVGVRSSHRVAIVYQFGDQQRQQAFLEPYDDGRMSAFAPGLVWIDSLVANQATTLTLEVPIHGLGARAATFDLDGAGTAIGQLKRDCVK